jgi:hypothetical protein
MPERLLSGYLRARDVCTGRVRKVSPVWNAVDQVGGIGGVMKKKIGWGILGTVAASIISLVVYAAPVRALEIIGVYFAVVGLITLGLYLAID